VRRWTNWARNVRATPAEWHTPASLDEIVELVRSARDRASTVRVVGAGHSWSSIAAPDQIGASLDRHAGLVSLDRDLATVKAGTRLKHFLAALAEHGRTLAIVGSIAEQSLAGAIATGTHGSSLTHGNLASLVEHMQLVDGRANVHELSGDRLVAARVHLGALGIVSQLTFRTVPRFALAEVIESIPVERVAASIDAIARSAEYVKIWWMPHTKHAAIFRYHRTTDANTGPDPIRQRWLDDKLMHRWVFPAILRLGRVPRLTQLVSPLIGKGLVKPTRIGDSPLMLSTPYPTRHREAEAAVPLSRAGEAFDRLVHCIARDRLTVNFIAEARFVPADPAWMSPAYGQETCQLGAYCYGPGADAYFASFWREMRAMSCARPHWGKEMDHGLDEIRACFPRTDDFRALRDELDPDRTFGSAFHTRILGA
jgi:L-gulonolactone oxidase